jgi:ketosteroid isomerase-like protein
LAEFSRAVEKTLEGWKSWEMRPESFQARQGRVAVVVRYRARGRGSGVVAEGRESALWSVRDGKVTRYEWFHGPEDAAEALELGR